MNCENFNSLMERLIPDENASGEPMNDRERKSLNAHSKTCAACAATLADEEQLALAMRSLRHATRSASAPAHLETSLRKKFRSQASTTPQNVGATQIETLISATISRGASLPAKLPKDEIIKRAPISRATKAVEPYSLAAGSSIMWKNWIGLQRPAPQAGAFLAAILLIAAALFAIGQHDPAVQPSSPQLAADFGNAAPDTRSSAVNEYPKRSNGEFSDSGSRAAESGEQIDSYTIAPLVNLPVALTSAPIRKRGDTKHLVEFNSRRGKGRNKTVDYGQSASNPSPEIATAFLPLVEADSLAAIESGHIMRVEMPRQALVSFGLPMNQERAGELVKADVLLGDDGVARAIRFVR